MLLPEIITLYEAHASRTGKNLTVDVSVFLSCQRSNKQQLIESLSNVYNVRYHLNISIDPSLLGGAVIRAGDLVIDGSVRGKLNKLGTGLAA